MGRQAWAAILAAGILISAGAARAQTEAPVVYGDSAGGDASAGVIDQPSQVAACLCSQRELDDATQAMTSAKATYQAAQQRDLALRQQVDASRGQVNPADTDALDAYRRLVRQSEQATADFYNTATPDYDKAVKRYNAAVATYNGDCAGRGIDPGLKAQVAANLYCPAPPSP
jgi:hypothetical protein